MSFDTGYMSPGGTPGYPRLGFLGVKQAARGYPGVPWGTLSKGVWGLKQGEITP